VKFQLRIQSVDSRISTSHSKSC